MREERGDIWDYSADIKVVTTNGDVNARGAAVMGRGVALQVRQIVPGIEFMLADSIHKRGNVVSVVACQARMEAQPLTIISFPVKHHWMEQADTDLIRRSAQELAVLAEVEDYETVAMPRPGCGNGGLAWEIVRPVIQPILGDRFVIVERRA